MGIIYIIKYRLWRGGAPYRKDIMLYAKVHVNTNMRFSVIDKNKNSLRFINLFNERDVWGFYLNFFVIPRLI
ncbi:hypothetical protein EUY23_25020 [Salmonella enterica]|nr:hypothetical protein [Salmonella enterica]